MKIELTEKQVNFLKIQIAQTIPHLIARLESDTDIRNRLIIKATIDGFEEVRIALEEAKSEEDEARDYPRSAGDWKDD